MNPEQLYINLGRLIESAPTGENKNEVSQWLGRAYALAMELNELAAAGKLTGISDQIPHARGPFLISLAMPILYRLLALAEIRAPASAQGAFINAGNAFDAMAAVGKVLAHAKTVVRIVDPYMDEKALSDFAVLAAEGIQIELLSDAATAKPSLTPAVGRFVQQFGSTRPLTARLAAARSLHDRLIVVDGATPWLLTQSLNAFAARSPATIVRIDGDAAPLKIAAYEAYWNAATSI
ncbi:phosphatidylserine/phosphatidylglycerophosphate/cardiolipin synthase family protein [Mesorhizobium sp. VK4C]|uniref:phosphatidylserine/phosphatidylglycerophosphate/ cardiolipin synthase family protein n=1 Tax=Mesorhizobium captivum TaxID=3072319 RepID=UPI002A23FFE0|nr:phosphatidylserine/phosphatidylglycerophosphate/cardiolipin synthase family protein [Mesorhizobium sp. VK4C]MDX8499884.1 phosphatidylserine/phosphatidylglycerophosphate/cardiolipin synthase family protein [Mesorhizobium sp. VK4C]